MMGIVIVMMIANIGFIGYISKAILSSSDDHFVPIPLYDISNLKKRGVRQIINKSGVGERIISSSNINKYELYRHICH